MLTDNGTHFTTPGNKTSAASDIKLAMQRGERFRAQNDIDHRLTKPRHSWTNGQVERMNRTVKEATVKRFATRYDRKPANFMAFLCLATLPMWLPLNVESA